MRFLALLVVSSAMLAMDGDDAFWSGWRKAGSLPSARGIYADGSRVVAWSDSSYLVSEDAGNRWSEHRLPAVSLRGGAAPAAITQCVVIGKVLWIVLADGRLVDAAGTSGNHLLGGLACARLAADQDGTLYAERGDGALTVAVVRGTIVAQAPGRLAAVLDHQAVVMTDRKVWAVSSAEAKPLRDYRGTNVPGNWPVQSGPGPVAWRDQHGASWALAGGGLENQGVLEGVRVLGQGYWGWDNRLLCLLQVGQRVDIVSARPKDLLRSGDWRDGMPAELIAVTGCPRDPDWPDTRHRLVAVAGDSLWVWRNR